jgi:hypothetical protein
MAPTGHPKGIAQQKNTRCVSLLAGATLRTRELVEPGLGGSKAAWDSSPSGGVRSFAGYRVPAGACSDKNSPAGQMRTSVSVQHYIDVNQILRFLRVLFGFSLYPGPETGIPARNAGSANGTV